MRKEITTIQIFKSDAVKIRELAKVLEENMGLFVSQRSAIMLAIDKLLKEEKRKDRA